MYGGSSRSLVWEKLENSPFSQTVGAGMNLELKRLVFNGEASYDNTRKTNDNTGNNPKGHTRRLGGDAFYRMNKWYAGGGASWSQLSTTNYSKQSWHPRVGGGRDWFRDDFSIRGQVMYVLPGSDHQNAVQGPEFSLWIPSPATSHHLFWYETVGIYEFHQTVTDPANLALTKLQTGNRSATGWVTMTMMYRF